MIKIDVYSTRAAIRYQEPLTVGLVGAKVRLSFSDRWKSLTKTVVFRQGDITRDVVGAASSAAIPWEVLQEPGIPLEIGIYGTNADGTVVIPTVWVSTDPVCTAADPSVDPSTSPSQSVWAQILSKLGNLDQLDTQAKDNLVSAINEANRAVFVVTVTKNEDGTYSADKLFSELQTAREAGKVLLCYWEEHNVWLMLSSTTGNIRFAFRAVKANVEYCISMSLDAEGGIGIASGRTTLATAEDKLSNPEKLTFTGATEAQYDGSVAVTVEIPKLLEVTLTQNADGTWSVDTTYAQILAAYNSGVEVRCRYGSDYVFRLSRLNPGIAAFYGLIGDVGYEVLVSSSTVTVSQVTWARSAAIPKTLPNPNLLTFTGAATGTYDGSEPLEVEIPKTLWVTVTENEDGTYTADRAHSEILAAHNAGRTVCCQYNNMLLPLTRAISTLCFFSCVYSGNQYTVIIRPNSGATVTTTAIGSGGTTDLTGYATQEYVDEAVASIEHPQGVSSNRSLKPSFAWIDDDGKAKVEHLYQWAVENNVPFTSAVISGKIDNDADWLTSQRMLEMYDSGLVRFASHTQNHVKLSEADAATVEAELSGSKAQIEGFGVPCDVMVYPNGAIGEASLGIVRRYFPFGFVAGGTVGDNNIPNSSRVNTPPIDTYQIRRVSIRGDFTSENGGFDYLKAQIDDTVANNGLLVFMSHVGSTDDGSGNGTYLDVSKDLEVYSRAVAYIRDWGYDIEPLMTACRRFENLVDSEYFCIGADGASAASKGTLHTVEVGTNAYTSATLPSGYPQNQITTCRVNGDSGTPYATQGILTAYLVGGNAYRTFMPSTKAALYLQIKSTTADAWLGWTECNRQDLVKLNNNKILNGTLPSQLNSGITVSLVSASAEVALLPEGVMGYMTAYNLFASSANAREEWQPNGSPAKYVRYATSESTWSDWYVFTPTLYSAE